MTKFHICSRFKDKKITALFVMTGILLLFIGCITIHDPYGKGPETGQICAKVDSDEKGAHGVEIEAVGIGGPHALEKYTNSKAVQGPFKQTEICVGVSGDPNLQKWQITVKVTDPEGKTKKKVFDAKTYNY